MPNSCGITTVRSLRAALGELSAKGAVQSHFERPSVKRPALLGGTVRSPWRERDNLDVIAILDLPSWTVLLGLLDECPVVPRIADPVTERISTETEFIAQNCQIVWAQAFVEDLPRRLLE